MILTEKMKKIVKNNKVELYALLFIALLFVLVLSINSFNKTYSKITNINDKMGSNSRVEGTTVYVDDKLSDLYYYNSLNYTESSNGTLPSGIDQNIYNDSNMVNVMITYSGIDTIHNNLRGTVSLSENYDTYVYYHCYPVKDGKVTIPLIDNPFTNRPNGKGFNGWISNQSGVNVVLDLDVYERYVEVTLVSSGNSYNDIELNFFASWIDANVANTSDGWTSVFNDFETKGLHTLNTTEEVCVYQELSEIVMDGYYLRHTADRYSYYSGYYVNGGRIQNANNRYCNTYGGCTYYTLIEDGSLYNSGTTYYRRNDNGNNFTTVTATYIREQTKECHDESIFSNDEIMAGYYVSKDFSRNESIDGYYDSNGNLLSGNCNNYGGCTYYEYLDKYDSNGNINYFNANNSYYYCVTRDLNIVYLNSNITGGWSGNKPFTFTGLNNGTLSSNRWTTNGNITLTNDTTIENMTISSGTNYSYADLNNSRLLNANYYNLKIGRGLKKYNNYVNFNGVVGGSTSTGSSGNDTRYKLIIESGYYNNTSVTEPTNRSNYDNLYIQAEAVFGNDLDRITTNNDNLEVYYEATASWAGNIRSSNDSAVLQVVKSGKIGTSKHDMYTGMYVGGVLNGTYYAARSAKIEGGWIYNLIGGPLTASSRSNVNDTYIYMTGGDVDLIVAGAGRSSSYGNRIVSVTGGKIKYSILGGSNGSGTDTSNGDGTLYGSSFIYVGGNAIIGDDTLTGNDIKMYGVEYGNVFGNGNGKEGYDGIGSNDNSNIIIDNKAHILNNVFGGGNYGATGISSTNNTNTTNIYIKGGTVDGSVYGGGNNNGAGSSSKTATVNIVMDDGIVNGSVYGGSKAKGIIYGNVNVDIKGGTINDSVYGGGEGGTTNTNNNNNGTYVSGNVNVTIGELNGNNTIPKIVNSVYGGSALGTVNSATNSSSVSSTSTHVIVNSGTIQNVFGGGEGDNTYTPYVCGNVIVDINGGIIENAFGANNLKGTPNGMVTLNVNGGTITNAYAGGNQTEVASPYINLLGGTVTNAFGGGNSAKVTTSNVLVDGGTVTNVFGGSNASGNVTTSNVVINSGTVTNAFGGNNVGGTTDVTNVTVNDGTIDNVYGGGEQTSVTSKTNVNINSFVTNVFGGSDSAGQVKESIVNINSNGSVTNAYGGNNLGGITETTNVNINGAATNVYGGGEQTDVTTTTNVNINGTATNVFGGSNSNGEVKKSVVNINTSGVATNVYGGNNLGGKTVTSNVIVDGGTVTADTYGGGLKAITDNTNVTFMNNGKSQNVYGGGNEGNISGSTNVVITGSEISKNVFGGGNAADVLNNTNVNIDNSTILENIYGGGNNGMVIKDANTIVTDSSINKSIYAGGNGATAIVIGSNMVNIEGTSSITEHVFGGGNAAATGCENDIVDANGNVIYSCANPNSSTSEVNIAGATILGNVYGGANTSVVYGETYVNIGTNTINENLKKGNVTIGGTVFGGGEANASGSEDYDFNFISVTKGININIDGSNHDVYDISGSIFGSGNASSSGGYSYINIKNYGTVNNPKKNISIQRTDVVTLDNSSILLSGAQDRTNKYKNELFTFSRIGNLKLKNNSTLYLEKGANLLESFSSLVDVNGEEQEAVVTINDKTNTISKNVDNRIYMFEGKNLNISDDESLATFGDVVGMTFFGMYKIDRNGKIATGLYSSDYDNGDSVSGSELYYFSSGSYVVGKHKSAHDIQKDGFYSNFANEEGTGIVVNYIKPTPSDATYYRWVIGEAVEVLELSITASKYATLGTKELQLMDYYQPNTEIYVLGVNYDYLSSDINILPSDEIPRYATNSEDANKNFGLGMKTGTVGWITKGGTEFSTTASDISGNTYYKAENSNAIPSFIFYLYHSKNITETKNLGVITISLMVVTPIDDLSNKIQRINIEVTMNSAFYDGDNYEATIAPGAQYEMFANANVNITTKSTFSTYFSLYSISDTSIYKDGYTRSLVSNFAYPENTKITMIDFASSGRPEYYYYIIDSNTYNNSVTKLAEDGEISYSLSKFIKMGSSDNNNTYNDELANSKYYDSSLKKAEEEFIFIVDLKDTNLNEDILNKTLLIELRDSNNNPIVPVLDVSQQKMFYNLYNDKEALLNLSADLSNDTLYVGQSIDLNATTSFTQQTIGNITIIDTNYYEKKLGIKLSLYNNSGDLVNGASLLGTAFVYNGVKYYPRQDGTVRFNIAETVANVSSRIKIDAEKSDIPSGDYTLVAEAFGSADGIYYGIDKTSKVEKNITIVNEMYGLDAILPNEDVIVDKNTGFSQDNNNYLDFQVMYESSLKKPSIRVSMYRRTYDDIYDYNYELVDLQDYVTNELELSNEEKIYIARNLPNNKFQYILYMKENLVTGTYQIRFNLYDDNNYVGHINKYIIIE